MTIFWGVLLGAVAFFWLVQAVLMLRGLPQLPRLNAAPQLADADCPRVSIVFSARDEAETLPLALASMLALDYPDYEVIAVNDRSTDATPRILEEFAGRHRNLKVVHMDTLPPGWLGKTHGLQRGYEASTGRWLLFTDADVQFAPEVVRRAMAIVLETDWDHFSLMPRIDLGSYLERAMLSYGAMMMAVGVQPWRLPDPKSNRYFGAGLFQLVRREAYEAAGTHHRLKLEVLDDLKLGKIVKRAGFRSGLSGSAGYIELRWYSSVSELIRGLTKNSFASLNYRVELLVAGILGSLTVSVFPYAAVLLFDGWLRVLAGLALLAPVTLQIAMARELKVRFWHALAHPLAALLFLYAALRSAAVTLWQGGVEWRGTFYPLKELRKGLV